jgi:hypothetical protein
MNSELKDVLGLLFQRADAMQTFWNFYAGAVTAALGVVTAGRAQWLNRAVCAGLTAAFVVFAIGNFVSLNAVRAQRAALMRVAEKTKGYDDAVRGVVVAVKPPDPWELWLFHGALDAATIAAIWGIPLARRRHERAGSE